MIVATITAEPGTTGTTVSLAGRNLYLTTTSKLGNMHTITACVQNLQAHVNTRNCLAVLLSHLKSV